MSALTVLRRLGVGGGVATFSLAATAAAANATPPLTQFREAQSNVAALVSAADTPAKHVLQVAVADLSEATSEALPAPASSGLWVDPSHAIPPPFGNVVFQRSTAAVNELYRVINDRTVPNEALTNASNEILEGQNSLAASAVAEVQGYPTPPGTALSKWRAAYAALGKQITAAVTAVPLASVEQGALAYLTREGVGPKAIGEFTHQLEASALTDEGKPEIFYYGSEGCPFCAVDRWSLLSAMARFGKFSALAPTVSSTTDIFPATHTVTFYKAKYTSAYVKFVPVEAFTTLWTPLQMPTAGEQELLNSFDSVEYEGQTFYSFPFLDLGNKWQTDTTISPGVLAGMSWQQIAALMAEPGSSAAQEIDFVAELVTAEVCNIDGERPIAVCGSELVRGFQENL